MTMEFQRNQNHPAIVRTGMSTRGARVLYAIIGLAFLTFSALAQGPSNHYALILADPPVVDRFAGRQAARSTAAQSYRAEIESKQESLKSELASRHFQV